MGQERGGKLFDVYFFYTPTYVVSLVEWNRESSKENKARRTTTWKLPRAGEIVPQRAQSEEREGEKRQRITFQDLAKAVRPFLSPRLDFVGLGQWRLALVMGKTRHQTIPIIIVAYWQRRKRPYIEKFQLWHEWRLWWCVISCPKCVL